MEHATMPGMRRYFGMTPLLFVFLQSQEPAPCPPCAEGARSAEIRARLEEAFALALATPNCTEADNLGACRDIERLLSESFESLRLLVTSRETSGSIECLGCDPGPHLGPIFSGFESLTELLLSKSYPEFEATRAAMAQELELWKAYRCCGAEPARTRPSGNREMDARAVIDEKCGDRFERNRQRLRQVVRMPGDRPGCYQSRRCRSATQYNGAFMEAGFWTYDGEYWYVWAERLTPRGEWITCDP